MGGEETVKIELELPENDYNCYQHLMESILTNKEKERLKNINNSFFLFLIQKYFGINDLEFQKGSYAEVRKFLEKFHIPIGKKTDGSSDHSYFLCPFQTKNDEPYIAIDSLVDKAVADAKGSQDIWQKKDIKYKFSSNYKEELFKLINQEKIPITIILKLFYQETSRSTLLRFIQEFKMKESELFIFFDGLYRYIQQKDDEEESFEKESNGRLIKYRKEYDREEVHDIFDPDSEFIKQRGTWGALGVVRIPNRDNDFVFFVTFGTKIADHEFDENITEDGVLTWQSQPSQKLTDPLIRTWINHDEAENTIYLFLRRHKRENYRYLGKLKYLIHNNENEKPVYFKWQILDFDKEELVQHFELDLIPKSEEDTDEEEQGGLIKVEAPPIKKEQERQGTSKSLFSTPIKVDYIRQQKMKSKIGLGGELLVLDYEKTYLKKEGKIDLAERVRHVAIEEGDGAGYDILSFETTGEEKYIEVKTTIGDATTDFFATAKEVKFSEEKKDSYYIYRVFSYNEEKKSGKFWIHKGSFTQFLLTPTNYRVSI
jgi:hypothetical protein